MKSSPLENSLTRTSFLPVIWQLKLGNHKKGLILIESYDDIPLQVLLSICSLLTDCNPADPLVGSIATQVVKSTSLIL